MYSTSTHFTSFKRGVGVICVLNYSRFQTILFVISYAALHRDAIPSLRISFGIEGQLSRRRFKRGKIMTAFGSFMEYD